MDKRVLSNMFFDNYYVDNFSLKVNDGFKQEDVKVNLHTAVDVSVDPEVNNGTVRITLVVWDKAFEDNYPFRLEVSMIGEFSADEDMDHGVFCDMCRKNGTTIMFPFLRSAVTDITKIANLTPLVLPLFNINKLLEEEKK